jgi:hypothetical protein
LQNIMVPEAEHLPAKGFQMLRAPGIALASVLAAIGFDDEPALNASEVGDEWPDCSLPAKLESAKIAISEMVPKLLLGVGRVTP